MFRSDVKEKKLELINFQPLFLMSATMLSISLVIYTIVFASIRYYSELLFLHNKSMAIILIGDWNFVRSNIEFAIIMFFTAFILSGSFWAFQGILKSDSRLNPIIGFVIFCILSLGLLYLSLSLLKLQELI